MISDDELVCFVCHRTPSEILEYVQAARWLNEDEPGRIVPMTPEMYVRRQEGTLNFDNGHFACTACYLAIGQPSSSRGWVAP